MNAQEFFSRPLVQFLIVALTPAFIVLIIEEIRMPGPYKPPAVEYAFNKKDLAQLNAVAAEADILLKSLDEVAATPTNSTTEPACFSNLRNGAYAYMSSTLGRLRQEVATSIEMQNQDDEAYINSGIANLSASALAAVPVMENTVSKVVTACNGDSIVAQKAFQAKAFIEGRMKPVVSALQSRVGAAQ